MKIIVSHDVDHLFAKDHIFRDLIYPKLWVRSFIEFLKKKITFKELFLRSIHCFKKERHCIDALMEFDRKYGVPSVFFFGMAQGLGMSYYPHEAKNVIKRVSDNGFSVGVHGIEYTNKALIKKEYNKFCEIMNFGPAGIRMHYVRFDENTFENVSEAGYVYDTTEFDKLNCGTQKAAYKVGKMWEFPLAIMDGYLPQSFDAAKTETLKKLKECEDKGLEYVTVLFHDYQFCDDFKDMKAWYEWLIEYVYERPDMSFISYENAIKELESKNGL